MFESKTPRLEAIFALLRNQSLAAKKPSSPKSDSALAADGALRRARKRAVIREVFSSLAPDAVPSSRRLPGNTATVAGKAVNYRLLRSQNSNREVNAATKERAVN